MGWFEWLYLYLGVSVIGGLMVFIAVSIAEDGKPDRDANAMMAAAHFLIWPLYLLVFPLLILVVFGGGIYLWIRKWLGYAPLTPEAPHDP